MMTRTIIPKNNEYAETPCFECECQTLKIKRLRANTQRNQVHRLSVTLGTKCDTCGHWQDIQLVELP